MKKFKSAKEAQTSRKNKKNWEDLLTKYQVNLKVKPRFKPLVVKLDTPEGRSCRHIPSLDTGRGSPTILKEKKYTGSTMLGIATMHKSNSIPVFNKDSAIDLAKMRR